ncbi:type ISP restriction/modification enzyme [Helicobacter sp.]|uniref:type ISP restriction/modification enzyme n=1 Tax=Helicobacter sp. TaxID=218 RepID=UPI00388EF318
MPPPLLESKPKIIIFSTYQSLQVIIDAKLPPFKIILNDEAHRTAGVQKITAQGEVRDISIWQKTHDNDLLPATYRLYLTATPRVYGPKAKERLQKTKKEKNLDEDLMLFSMDDEGLFGSEIYRLDFANAIEQGLLSDFRVIISYVSEEFAAKYLATLTKEQNNSNLNIIDAGKMVAFANAINKQHLTYVDEQGRFEACSDDGKPMKRAVVFHSSIRDSKFTTKCFAQGLISRSIDFTHIDGKDNAYEKASKLSWLKESSENTRVLSNAKCLTEGIDVPNLDAVCFFSKRDSVVDVVQAVGRAIRKADSKKYGYIILPLVLTEQEIAEYDKTLKGDKFKIVWQVLIALRSHDERLIDEARVNEILQLEREFEEKEVPEATLFTIEDLFKEMKNAVPKNLGDLQYWENYASKVGDIMQALILRIQALLDSSPAIQKLFSTFCKALQGNLNASFNESEAIALVAQHIITKPIFECIFPSLDFTTFDKVSAELEKLHTKLLEQGLNAETKTLEKFYTSVRQSAEYAKSDKSKQSLIKNLYDTLFKQAFKKTQEKLGIVYTPIEGVDFIIHSTQYLLQKHFGKSLGDEHIHIADPFVGTGTFITRLIQSGYLDSNLESKFTKELWANEITLLGYYIAQINIATTYHERLIALGDSALGNHSADFGDLEATADPKSSSAPKSPKNYESTTTNLRNLEEEKQAGRGNPKNTDSSETAQSVATQQAEAVEMRNRGFQAGGEGSYLSGNDRASSAESAIYRSNATPTEIKLFDNLLFTDTFNTYAPDSKGFIGSKDGTQTTIDSLPYLEKNYAKIQEFKNTQFKIFLTNPPYSAGQKSGNDNNKNESYPFMDSRIAESYVALSKAQKFKYDSFKRAIRFMSDRIGESGGIIGFITNGSFIESNGDDGLRACLADEFDYIYIINLRGNIAKTKQDKNSGEGQNFFGNASSTPVAICFFVKLDSSVDSKETSAIAERYPLFCHADKSARNDRKATIYYHDIGDNLSTQQKRNIIANLHSIQSLESQGLFTLITPNKDYDWINQRDYSFMAYMPIGNPKTKRKALPLKTLPPKTNPEVLEKNYVDIFEMYSAGVVSGRDSWVYNFSAKSLESTMTRMIDNYNAEVEKHKADSTYQPTNDSTKINWTDNLKSSFKKGFVFDFNEAGEIIECAYRPFTKCHLYLAKHFNEMLCQMPQLFPTPRTQEIAVLDCEAVVSKSARDFYATHRYLPNRAICISTDNRSPFSALMTSFIPDLSFTAGSQCFPLYYYERVESSAENGQMTMDYDLAESMDRHADKSTRNDKNTAYYKRKDAIRDEALAFFQKAYNDSTITKEAMFYYIYAILNHKDYIAKYKDNLSKMLPRIPLMQDFLGFVASGRALAQLHLEYESFCDIESMSVACGAFACLKGDRDTASKDQGSLFEQESREKARQDIAQLGDGDFTLIKPIHFLAKGYKHTIIFNDKLSIVNIPAAAHRYQVNGKSAIEWILDRYKISTDKASGIVNDPNLYESTSGALSGLKGGRYVCALLLSIIEMSVRTSKILESMPEYKLL